MEFKNVAAIVTGGASGLGEGAARALAAAGCKVAILDLQKEQGEKVAADIGGIFLECDVSSASASKGGVVALTLQSARELAREGIRVNTIAPGLFMTPMMAGMPEEVQDSLAATLPFPKRLGKPEEFGMMVDQMVRNPILNGEVIRLDCALRMAPK